MQSPIRGHANLAQLVEHFIRNERVVGSIPIVGSKHRQPVYPFMSKASFGGIIIFILLVCYLINCFSPLRLEYDSIRYFSLKDCLNNACPEGFRAADDPHPYGYVMLLWGLGRMGLLHPFVIAFVNLVFLAGALFFCGKLFQGRGSKKGLGNRDLELGVILLLLSYPIVKISAYALSEMQYLFFSFGALYFLRIYLERGRRIGSLVLIFLFAGLAIFTRTAGIALLPAMAAGAGWHYRAALKRYRKAVAGVVLLALVSGAVILVRMDMGLYANSVRVAGAGWKVLLWEHLSEWGELLLNVPASKFPKGAAWIFGVIGLGFIGWVAVVTVRQRKKLSVAPVVYLACYSILIFYWPFYDVRFWIPVAPVIVMVLLHGRSVRLARLFVLFFIVAGVGAMGYSLYTSFNKRALARSQAGGRYRNEYETHFFGRPQADTAAVVDPYVLHVLETCK